MQSTLRAIVVAIGMAGCAPAASAKQLTSRASFDLACPSASLRYKKIDDRTQGVLGCGKQATYVESCDRRSRGDGERGCTWVLNGRIEAGSAAPPAAPPPSATTPAPVAVPTAPIDAPMH
jgi:hypothetical protein